MGSINDVDPAQAPIGSSEQAPKAMFKQLPEDEPQAIKFDSGITEECEVSSALSEAICLIQGRDSIGSYDPSIWSLLADAIADCAEGSGTTGKKLRQIMLQGNVYVRHLVSFILNWNGRDDKRAVDMAMLIVSDVRGLSSKDLKFAQKRSYYSCVLLMIGEALVPDDVWKCPLMTRKQRTRVQSVNGQKLSIAEFQETLQSSDSQWSVRNPWVVTPLMDSFLKSIKAQPSLLCSFVEEMERNEFAVPHHGYLVLECLMSWEGTFVRQVLADQKCTALLSLIRQFSDIGARDVVLKTLGLDSINSAPLDWRSLKLFRCNELLEEILRPVTVAKEAVELFFLNDNLTHLVHDLECDLPPPPNSDKVQVNSLSTISDGSNYILYPMPRSQELLSDRKKEILNTSTAPSNKENIASSKSETFESHYELDKRNVKPSKIEGSTAIYAIVTSSNLKTSTISSECNSCVSKKNSINPEATVLQELNSSAVESSRREMDKLVESWDGRAAFLVAAIEQTQAILTLSERTPINPSRTVSADQNLPLADSKRSAYDPLQQLMLWLTVNGEDNLLIKKCMEVTLSIYIKLINDNIRRSIDERTLTSKRCIHH
eukprot:GHVL01031824.1.p1 GENE.GHVL01031824.1~~GHVL01031824.1.p1  ORF type:complete len:601 (-),score=83.30 GHVL01031824.1:2807-4609(-)